MNPTPEELDALRQIDPGLVVECGFPEYCHSIQDGKLVGHHPDCPGPVPNISALVRVAVAAAAYKAKRDRFDAASMDGLFKEEPYLRQPWSVEVNSLYRALAAALHPDPEAPT